MRWARVTAEADDVSARIVRGTGLSSGGAGSPAGLGAQRRWIIDSVARRRGLDGGRSAIAHHLVMTR